MRKLPSKEKLNDLFTYKNGHLFWREWNRRKTAGSIGINTVGRANVGINGTTHNVARVIFKMHHGFDPDYCDHIDENQTNNRIENLQSITAKENIVKSVNHRIKNKTFKTNHKIFRPQKCISKT